MDFKDKDLEQSKHQKNYKIALFTSLLIAIEGIIMTIINLCEGRTHLIYTTIIYSVLMLISFFHVLYSKKLQLFYVNSFAVIFYLEIDFIITGGAEGFGVIWLSLIPLFGMYCLEFKPFLILVTSIYVILVAAFFTPLSHFIYSFLPSFKRRFTIFFLVDAAFASFLKYRITQTEQDLARQKTILSRELNQAGLIQATFYKKKDYNSDEWDIGYKNIPMAVVTGDLFDFCTSDNKIDGFGLYDISGHGISSGLLTMLLKNIVHQEFYADTECELWETVNRINDRFIEEKEDVSNYTTGIITRLKGNQIEFVNAAHPSPIIYRKKTETINFVPTDPKSVGPIGLRDLPAIYNSQFITLESGDELILYTDGLTECKNIQGEEFNEANLQNAILQYLNESAQTQCEKILDDIVNFRGKKTQSDDYTIIIIRRK